MTLHVIVESDDAVDFARSQSEFRSPVWWTTSPYVWQSLNAAGEQVNWLDGCIPNETASACATVSGGVADGFAPVWQDMAVQLDWPRLPFVLSRQMNALLLVLLFKGTMLAEWVGQTNGDRWVIGDSEIRPPTGPQIGIDRFDTLFAALAARWSAADLDVKHLPKRDMSHLYGEIDRPTMVGRLLSYSDLSTVQLCWRYWRKLLGGRPFRIRRGGPTVVVGSENEALREMLPSLLRKRCTLRTIPGPGALDEGEAMPEMPDAGEIAAAIDRERQRAGVSVPTEAIAEILAPRLAELSRWLVPARAAGKRMAAALDVNDHGQVFLTSTVRPLPWHAFSAELAAAKQPTVLVQHGVSAGLPRYHEVKRSFAEHKTGQSYLVNSTAAEAFYDSAGQESDVDVRAIGLAEMTRRIPGRRLQRFIVRRQLSVGLNSRVVMYVTSAVQNNIVMQPHMPLDSQTYERMQTVAHDVLPKVRGRPCIKLYATARYVDPMPLERDFRAPPPVKTFKAGDFRFMRAAADILIVESPFSTLGWALGAGIPLFYLCDPAMPLLPGAREAIEAAVFFIDLSDPGWPDRLLASLNRPDREIAADWRAKASVRAEFLDRYVFGPKDAGRNGAEAVLGYVRQPDKDDGMKAVE